jgi:hypothetical protein
MNFPDNLDDLSSSIENAQIIRARDSIKHYQQHPDMPTEQQVLNFLIQIQICATHLAPMPCHFCMNHNHGGRTA